LPNLPAGQNEGVARKTDFASGAVPVFLITFTVLEKLLALRRSTFATNVEPSFSPSHGNKGCSWCHK
jgi:hypothetical protein